MKFLKIKNLFYINTILFFLFFIFFLIFPKFDITFSKLYFENDVFISERIVFIKILRTFLKNLMIIIPIILLIFFLLDYYKRLKKIKPFLSLRLRFSVIGFIIGPIIGSGIIANWYFKDHWGRARPVQISEFGGVKKFTPPFVKTDQCEKNCSWISGEGSAAFSFIVGTLILKNPVYFFANLFFGIVVSFCRISMGGHFLSDNLFALFFMVYLAVIFKYLVVKSLKYEIKKSI